MHYTRKHPNMGAAILMAGILAVAFSANLMGQQREKYLGKSRIFPRASAVSFRGFEIPLYEKVGALLSRAGSRGEEMLSVAGRFLPGIKTEKEDPGFQPYGSSSAVDESGRAGQAQTFVGGSQQAWVSGNPAASMAPAFDAIGRDVERWMSGEIKRAAPAIDGQIAKLINESFIYDPRVDGSQIHATIDDGVIILSGIVSGHEARLAAEQDVRHLKGVVDVRNIIEVR